MIKTIDEKIELKDCPFCGGHAEFKQVNGGWAVLCTRQCAGTRIFDNKNIPADGWNRRVNKNENI